MNAPEHAEKIQALPAMFQVPLETASRDGARIADARARAGLPPHAGVVIRTEDRTRRAK